MSNNKNLERYLELYSKYVDSRVGVHNYHVQFVNRLGQRSYYELREYLMKSVELERELRYAARDTLREQKEILRQTKRARIEERKAKAEARKAKRLAKNVDVSGGDSK